MASPLPISVLVLTRNEAINLPGLFASLGWCDDIHVIDSFSDDETLALATQAGAQVYSHAFAGFGAQRNWALDHCHIKYEWILFLDADETTPPDFVRVLSDAVTKADASIAGYYCCWRMLIDDVWLKRSDHFPKWQFRLLRRGRARFMNDGHGQREDEVQGSILYLKVPYDHHFLRKGWTDWLERHNRYSTEEARKRLRLPLDLRGAFSGNGPRRNRALKTWVSRIPGWPLVRFLMTYLLNLGFLEGKTGLIYCINLAYYEFLIQIKMSELQKARPVLSKTNPPESTQSR